MEKNEHVQSDGSVASELEGEERQQSAVLPEVSNLRLSPENRVETEANIEATQILEELMQKIDSLLTQIVECREKLLRLTVSLDSLKARFAEPLGKDEHVEATLTDLQARCEALESTPLWKNSLMAVRAGLRALMLSKGLTITPELRERLDNTFKLVEAKLDSEFLEKEAAYSAAEMCHSAVSESDPEFLETDAAYSAEDESVSDSDFREEFAIRLLGFEIGNIRNEFQEWKLKCDGINDDILKLRNARAARENNALT